MENVIDEQALNSIRDQLQEDPFNQGLHQQVYDALSGQDEARALIDFYRQLQRNNPDDWRHLVNLARAYSQTGKDSLAVVQLQKLLRSDPSLKEVWMDLARCYQRLKKVELALRALNSAIEVDPGFAEAHIERVRLLTRRTRRGGRGCRLLARVRATQAPCGRVARGGRRPPRVGLSTS